MLFSKPVVIIGVFGVFGWPTRFSFDSIDDNSIEDDPI